MKTENKFRVWDGVKYHYPECDLEKSNHYLQFGSDGVFFLHNSEGEYIAGYKDDAVIERFIGGLDKNGTEIYEGDCFGIDKVYGVSEYLGYVKWDNEIFAFVVILSNGGWEIVSEFLRVYKTAKIYTNINKNPELLKN